MIPVRDTVWFRHTHITQTKGAWQTLYCTMALAELFVSSSRHSLGVWLTVAWNVCHPLSVCLSICCVSGQNKRDCRLHQPTDPATHTHTQSCCVVTWLVACLVYLHHMSRQRRDDSITIEFDILFSSILYTISTNIHYALTYMRTKYFNFPSLF